MTLSLDDVRNKRFRMARKSGYEVLEVDEFVDEVEESFAQLIEENQNLKKQVDSLKSSPAPAPAAQAESAAPRPAATPAPAPTPAPAAAPPAGERIVVTTAKEASTAVVRLVEMSTEQAERLVAEATDDANRIREEANRTAHQVTTDARTRAERVESEARVNAERLQADATSRAEKLDKEIDGRRTDMFGDLEKQRDELTSTVSALRSFEAAYRSNLTSHLKSQIETLESGHAEPAEVPEAARNIKPAETSNKGSNGGAAGGDGRSPERDEEQTLGGGSPTSNTPRLDALLGDQR
jgi:DivIVA domain-containing protein